MERPSIVSVNKGSSIFSISDLGINFKSCSDKENNYVALSRSAEGHIQM